MLMSNIEDKIVEWAGDRNILSQSTPFHQIVKTVEEVSELLLAIEINDMEGIKDAIGDIAVTLIIQANMNGLSLQECIEHAYSIISKRNGEMIDGIFVKDE